MHKTILIIYLFLISTFTAVSIANGSEFHKNGFSISLPDEWVEIPEDVIDTTEEKLAKLNPNAQMPKADYGFQLSSSKNWFEYPYILIIINNSGRIPESQLKKLEEYPFKKVFNETQNELSSIISDLEAGKIVYDKQAKLMWMRTEANVPPEGLISGISCMVPTETGFIQISGYSLRDNFPIYEAIFQSVALSVSPEPQLAYKSKWSDSLPPALAGIDWGKVAGKAIVYGLIGGIIALIIGFKKRKNG
jgi:hypothetical protein